MSDRRSPDRPSAVRIALVYPDLLGTYGDGGNATVLGSRLRWRGLAVESLVVPLGTPLPAACDIYVLGGGEDAPQSLAAQELRREGTLTAAVDGGAAVLAVCAGIQVLGTQFLAGEGVIREGVGLVDADTSRALSVRAVGELVVEPDPILGLSPTRLSGYENHAGRTRLGPGVTPLGTVRHGVGNGDHDDEASHGVDGYLSGRVLGTYMHGPVLARNPELADLVLSWVVGTLPSGNDELMAADREAGELRQERLGTAHTPRDGALSTWGRSPRYPWLPTLPYSWIRQRRREPR
jgi:CobQ-like glutamine amidotransferase family enzyme